MAHDDEPLVGGLGDTDGVGDALVGGDAPHDDEEVLPLRAEWRGVHVDTVGDDGRPGSPRFSACRRLMQTGWTLGKLAR